MRGPEDGVKGDGFPFRPQYGDGSHDDEGARFFRGLVVAAALSSLFWAAVIAAVIVFTN